jgi:hypothetical protein
VTTKSICQDDPIPDMRGDLDNAVVACHHQGQYLTVKRSAEEEAEAR